MPFEHNSHIKQYIEKLYSFNYDHEQFAPPLKVVGAVISRWGEGDWFGATDRPNLSLSIITAGNARYIQNGHQGSLEIGDIYLAQKSKNQRFETGPQGFVHKRTVILEGASLDVLLQTMGLAEVDSIHLQNPSPIITLFRRIHHLIHEKPSGASIELSCLAYKILLECARTITPEYPVAIANAINYIRSNIHKRLSLHQIARETGVSVRHCNRLFQSTVGVSPIQFHLNERMNLARSILLNTRQSIKQIAHTIGYENPLRFSAQFKQIHGISPKAYRINAGNLNTDD